MAVLSARDDVFAALSEYNGWPRVPARCGSLQSLLGRTAQVYHNGWCSPRTGCCLPGVSYGLGLRVFGLQHVDDLLGLPHHAMILERECRNEKTFGCGWFTYLGVLLIFGCRGEVRPNPLKRARELVAVGDAREKAIELLGADSWHHQPCERLGGEIIEDLFFYGSHGYDEARIVILGSVFDGDEYKVTSIGSFDDANPWHTIYADCIDPRPVRGLNLGSLRRWGTTAGRSAGAHRLPRMPGRCGSPQSLLGWTSQAYHNGWCSPHTGCCLPESSYGLGLRALGPATCGRSAWSSYHAIILAGEWKDEETFGCGWFAHLGVLVDPWLSRSGQT